MNLALTILSVIPFFAYIFLLIKEEIINKKDYKLFRFDTLILFAIFIYFTTHKMIFVNKLLFFTINLYLFVNKLYDKKMKTKFNIKKYINKVLFGYFLGILTFIPYIIYRGLTHSYYLAFVLILFYPIIMIIYNKFVGKKKKKIKKKTKI